MSIHFSLCPPARLYNMQIVMAIVQLHFDRNINIQRLNSEKGEDGSTRDLTTKFVD